MTEPTKVLWHSNAPWVSTGYGQQTALFAPRLAARPEYDVRVSSFYGLEGASLNWNGLKILPAIGGTYGNEGLPYHIRSFFGDPRDGLLFTLIDVFVLDAQMCSQLNVASWVPVDHDPAPPLIRRYFEASGAVPVAMSRFGQERLADFDPVYVPHGVDTSVFAPADRQLAREMVGLEPDDFCVGIVAANKGNPSRKCFVAAFEAFAEIRRRHENAKLFLHTDVEGIWSGGVELIPLIEALGIPEDAIRRPDPYAIHFHPLAPELMAAVYSAMDVLLSPSAGEGFGIPVLEAQSCGVPAIVTDFSAMSEVCGAGWKVDYSRLWTAQKAWQAMPHVASIIDALEECYSLSSVDRAALAAQARSHALTYDADRVMGEFMLPALEAVQERLEGRSEPVEMRLRDAA